MYHISISGTNMIFTRWSHFRWPIHAGVAAQLPAEYWFLAVVPDFLTLTAGVSNRADRVTKALPVGKAGWVDMFA